MMDALTLLYQANMSGLYFWIEDDKLKFIQTIDIDCDELLEQATKFKQEILAILSLNKIYSEKDSIDHIYQTNLATAGLTSIQERFIFLELYSGGTSIYHIPFLYELNDSVDIALLEKSLSKLVLSHSILRTIFKENQQGQFYQKVTDTELNCIKKSYTEAQQLQHYIKSELARPFDLTKNLPIRVGIFIANNTSNAQQSDQLKNVLLINIHHIAFDAWSHNIFINELLHHYQNGETALIKNNNHLTISYCDYSLWQAQFFKSKTLTNQKKYWLSQLAEFEILKLPTDHPRPIHVDHSGALYHFTFNKKLSDKIEAIAATHNTTLFSVFLSAYYIFLSLYSGQTDLLVGGVNANRQHPQIENMIGCFVNTLVYRYKINHQNSFSEIISEVHTLLQHAQANQDLPFENLIELLEVEQDPSRHPIFQVSFDFIPGGRNDEFADCIGKAINYSELYEFTKFDLMLTCGYEGEIITGNFSYVTALFNQATIHNMSVCFTHIVNILADNNDTKLGDLCFIPPEQYRFVTDLCNKTEQNNYQFNTLVSVFESQVIKSEHHTAVECQGKKISYGELNKLSNQLANRINQILTNEHSIQTTTNQYVLICLDRSIEMIIAMLAVLKSDLAYVPIDPNAPKSRIEYILHDTQASLVLTTSTLSAVFHSDTELNILELDNVDHQQYGVQNLERNIQGNDIAYVIYTSGTTGQPKGVLISHAAIVNTIESQKAVFTIDDTSRCLQMSSLSFDASMYEIYLCLTSGATLVIFPGFDGSKHSSLLDFIETTEVTWATIVPSILELEPYRLLPSLKTLILAGESCQPALMQQWSQSSEVINAYGPTETAICATTHVYSPGDSALNIGIPNANTKVYILDHYLHPVPIGVYGQMYVSGKGLATGYLNQPQLTVEKFVLNPFYCQEEHEIAYRYMYRTGDVARRLENGDIEFLSRDDFQVKINGQRVELGEIEMVLNDHPLIRQSGVIFDTRSGRGVLSAFYETQGATEHTPEEALSNLHNYLATRLPKYMCPQHLTELPALPLSISGKIDRKALINFAVNSKCSNYIAPKSQIESQLCSIWSEVLDLKRIGVEDDFFRLGGDSILSIQICSRIRNIGYDCSIKSIFEHRTIAALIQANAISKLKKISSEQGELTGACQLLPIQSWFFEQKFIAENYFNQSFLIRVPQLEEARLEQAFIALAEHHDALRFCYSGQQQTYQPLKSIPFKLKKLDVSKMTQEEITNQFSKWQSDFDISKPPLWCAGYVTGFDDGSARIFFSAHHLIIDTVSWRIISDDIKRLYKGEVLNKKGTSYRQWVNYIRNYPRLYAQEQCYWQTIIDQQASNIQPLSLSEVNHASIEIDKCLTENLLTQSYMAYQTEINDLLLSALAYALKTGIGSELHCVMLEGHGRENLDNTIDLSQTVGWFTSQYPVNIEVGDTIGDTIKRTKEHLHNVPKNGIGYGAFCYAKDQSTVERGTLKNVIGFNYLGQLGSAQSSDQSWVICSESSGLSNDTANQINTLLSLNGGVFEGQLMFDFQSRLGARLTQELSHAFKKYLILIIQHCEQQIIKGSIQHTPSDFNTLHISQKSIDKIEQGTVIEGIYPATSLQQGFIYHALHAPSDDAYRVQLIWAYQNGIDLQLYKQAWQHILAEFPSLRLSFNWQDADQLVQIIHAIENCQLQWQTHDLTSVANVEKAIRDVQISDRKRTFDLSQPELIRFNIFICKNNRTVVMQTSHHAILDGWCTSILLKRLHSIYENLLNSSAVALVPDRAYVQAQQYYHLNSEQQKLYWQQQLSKVEHANDLSLLLTHRVSLDELKVISEIACETFVFEGAQLQQLLALTEDIGVTLNVVMQFAWHKLIQSYTQDKITIVGTTVSGRNIPVNGVEQSAGLYINTLPLIVEWDKAQSIADILINIQNALIDLNQNSSASLAELQTDGKALFHSIFVFENFPVDIESNKSCQFGFEFIEGVKKTTYPFELKANANSDKLTFYFNYDQKLIDLTQARYLVSKIRTILNQLSDLKNDKAHTINLLSSQERDLVLHKWNQIEPSSDEFCSIPKMISLQSKSRAEEIALVFGTNKLTYAELELKTDQLAAVIQQHFISVHNRKIQADDLIAVCLERSIEMVTVLLAILRSGATFVPIDPNYPKDRIDYILQDSNASALVTHSELVDSIDFKVQYKPKILTVDTVNLLEYRNNHISPIIEKNSLAYVIYTSGTTGRPKGVAISHHSFVSYHQALLQTLELGNTSALASAFTLSYCFDAALPILFLPLFVGGKVIVTESLKDTGWKNYMTILKQHSVNFVRFTPSMLEGDMYRELISLHQDMVILMGGGENQSDNY
jgi:amino acid adenylation domain-containing protein/non-ribosomal peptide synthase protein (TIGR01720 family)